jgi:hypothetical protein
MQAIPRRSFFTGAVRYTALFFALGSSMLVTGCSAVTDLENWIPIALASVAMIVKLLGPIVPAPVAVIIAAIQVGFSDLLTAIQNYKAGTGVLSDISNAITDIETSFASFFAALNVPAALLATIEGLAQLIMSTIQWFANKISPASTTTSAVIMGTKITYAPVKRSPAQYKSAWNTECVAMKHPEVRL